MRQAVRMLSLVVAVPGCLGAAELKVAVLHPLLADVAQAVGGERVEVVNLGGPGADPHKFEPGPKELQAAQGAQLYFVSGKGLEPYLGKLRDIVGGEKVVEVGASLPTLKAETLCDHGGHAHVHETDDPHWWHSTDCWRRAARVVAKELAKADPAGAEGYGKRSRQYRRKMEELERWARGELAKVPEERRVLATAHAAFGYFCHDFGWRQLPVQGLNREQVPSPKFVSEVAAVIRTEKVGAVFPEKRSNPKMLQTIAKETGVKVGEALIADGSGSVEGMFRHNVKAIVAALAPAH
ncbi:MAG: zinc ABC transporter substrate-binding protein [Akkermansiaceae bacterium]|nr:zinc ABC transporter substrate-binding protein [Akkermansiaceae bacterium]